MSLLKADTLKPVTSGGDLSLQGDSGGSAVDCLNITSAGDINFTGNTNAKIKLPSAGGIYESDGSTAILTESGGTVTLDNVALGSSVSGGFLYTSSAIICDKKAYNANGGTFTQDAWQQRELNTEINDADSIVLISSNRFTLGAGTYTIEWSAPAYKCNTHQSRLLNYSDTAVVEYGTPEHDAAGNATTNKSFGKAVTTIGGDKIFEIQHYCDTTKADTGFGRPSSFTGSSSIYTLVHILKHG